MRGANQEAHLGRLSEVSLTSHDSEVLVQSTKKLKVNKTPKKNIGDFEVIRGLGKGAFGKVYLIKEREPSDPMHDRLDILSINDGQYQDEELEVPEELMFQDKK